MIHWSAGSAGSDGLIVGADAKGEWFLVLGAFFLAYLVFQLGFWIGRSVGRDSRRRDPSTT